MLRIAVVGTFILLSGAAAFAADNASAPPPANPQSWHGGPCRTEVVRFCNDVPFGKGLRLACLARHKPKLSPTCQSALKMMQQMFAYGQQQRKVTDAISAKLKAKTKKQAAAKSKTSADGKMTTPPASQGPMK